MENNQPRDRMLENARVKISETLTQGTMEIDALRIWRIFQRQWKVIAASIICIVAVAALYVYQLPKKYTAYSLIMIGDQQVNVVDIESVVSNTFSYNDFIKIESEVFVVMSRSLGVKVVKATGLLDSEEFNPPPKEEGFIKKNIKSLLPQDLLDVIKPPKDEEEGEDEELTAEEIADIKIGNVVSRYLGALDVYPINKTRILTIKFTAQNPKIAARVANAVAELYIVEQLDAKYDAAKTASQWLDKRLQGLKVQVEASEQAVEAYKRTHGIVESRGMSIESQQLAELTSQYILARAKTAEANAKLRQLQELAGTGSSIESFGEVLASPLIQQLRFKEAEVERKISELSQDYGDRHPLMISTKAELQETKQKIKQEVKKILQSLRGQVRVARARESSLRQNLEIIKNQTAKTRSSGVQLRTLERESEANRALYETFLARFKETTEQQEFTQADGRIISKALIPSGASYPKKRLFLGFALIIASIVGVGLALLLEHLDSGFRSVDQIEGLTGLQVLGMTPKTVSSGEDDDTPENEVLKKPNSVYSEAVRSATTSLMYSNIDAPPKVVLFTSAIPGEGKSTIAVSMARQTAASGKSVLLIDGDLRRPILHTKVSGGPSRGGGLFGVLVSDEDPDTLIAKDKSGASYVASGKSFQHPENILLSQRMEEFLSHMRRKFDLIIIDSSPILAVSDTTILSKKVDKIVYVTRWESTPRQIVMSGLKTLLDSGADIAGIILSQVDVKKNAYYGYSDSGRYYSSKYHNYYDED